MEVKNLIFTYISLRYTLDINIKKMYNCNV